ncbi:polysialyltransferase family glycosyltransferase [Streptomyces caatingaensis]|uniref:Uncharacterized protein n=1 Tax=Streptomyces caatingaensis TaxID=1678637 RepID=A0A0K9XEU7_9ACTN|nr:polysialyltransferase family glycosyltransferase [Streptomyces caatingaensis]KNB51616.1 hypothetical protein AC230_14765 [Streptomyces caatingaensis]
MTRRPTVQLLLASTLYGVATLAAVLDAGLLPPAGRRLLVLANNAAVPETTPGPDEAPGFDRLRTRFDGVHSWNGTIRPFHPAGWSPRTDDVPLWERHLRLLWDLGDDDVEIVLESLQTDPALALARIFPGAPLEVYADGLMSYGPTRIRLDPLVGTRVRRLLHLDLVPGLRPLLLREFGVAAETVPGEVFAKVLAELADAAPELPPVPREPALLLGQYLAALGILTPEEEERLHVRMLRGAVARGHRSVVFKPHPTAPARWSRTLEEEARRLGADLVAVDSSTLAEVLYQRLRPALVVGCFSTALMTAGAFYGLPAVHTGTDLLLERLTPYQNSNRVPVTLVDALLPPLEGTGAPVRAAEAAELLAAVGYAMQPRINPDLRAAAERHLSRRPDPRYFKRRRLTALGLPGGVPRRLAFLARRPAVRRIARRVRTAGRRLAGRASA